MKRIMSSLFLIGGLCIYAGPSFADEATAIKFDAEQAQYNSMLGKINTVSEAFGYYKTVKDTYFYGDKGLKLLVEKNKQACIKFIDEWKNLMIKVDNSINDQNEISSFIDHFSIKDKFYTRELALKEIINDNLNIKKRLEEASNALAKIQDFPNNYLNVIDGSSYTPNMVFFNKQVMDLRDSIKNIEKLYDGVFANTLVSIQYESYNIITKKLDIARLNFGELKGAIDYFNELMLSEKIIAKETSTLDLLFQNLKKAISQNRIFAAEKILIQLQETAAENKKNIAAGIKDADLREKGLERVDGFCNMAKRDFDNTIVKHANQKYRFVLDYFKLAKTHMGVFCRANSSERLKYDCQLMRELWDFNEIHFRKMNDENLKYFESALDNVYAGPLSGGIKE